MGKINRQRRRSPEPEHITFDRHAAVASGCRSVFFDFFDLRRDIVLCHLKIELRLDIHPERGRRPEELTKPQCGVSGNRRLLARQPLNSRARHAKLRCHAVGRQLHRLQKLLTQNLTGMHWRKLFTHRLSL